MPSLHSAKVRFARALCSPIVGRALRLALRNRLPNRGCVFDAQDPSVTDAVAASIVWGFYESSERRFVDRHLDSDRDVIELGSSLGAVSSHIAKKLATGRKLVCVEANERLHPTLRRNVLLNAPALDARFVAAAVAYGCETVAFEVGAESIGSHIATSPDLGNVVTVPAITLSGLRADHGITAFSLVMDIEGAEVDLLFDDGDALADCMQIVAELHPATRRGTRYEVDDLVRRLVDALGFQLRARHGPVVVLDRH